MRVVVAMSGGVDSSVTAALLAEQGHEVVGITLQLYDHGRAADRPGRCCAGQDIRDARAVADHLAIPHYVLDFEARFRAAVVEDFAATYAAGRTPIPCVRCNQRIKFADLLQIARDLGATALATGHYARRLDGPAGPELHRAVDDGRDQSYFLFATTAEQLAFVWFPLGSMRKAEVRALAERYGLPVAAKPDSQDICFVPSGDHAALVGRLRPEALRPGAIVAGGGRVLGTHRGIARYTVGQRRGLSVATGERLYVVAVDAVANRVTVAPAARSLCAGAVLGEMSWLADPTGCPDVMVKHRANEPPTPGRVARDEEGRWWVRFARPQRGVAPGQACVVYSGTRVLGGGFIDAAPLLAAA